MRVLHLYAGNLFGGVETFLLTLGRERALSGMRPTFGLCFEGRLSQELRSVGADVQMLGAVRFSRPWSVWSARKNLRRLLDAEKFDLAISHSAWAHAVFATVVRETKLPLVYWAHGPANRHWSDRRANQTPPDLVIANSQHTLTTQGEQFCSCRRIVLPLAVSPPPKMDRQSTRAEVRRELQTPDSDLVIVCTSRMEAWKGHSLLLDAAAQLMDIADWRIWIAGSAQRDSEMDYVHSLESQVKRSGLSDRVQYLGQRSDVPRVLCAADIHCQPNVAPEPFGIAFVEALYAGLPVVTTDLGAAGEIVTESCGLLVAPEAAALADALRKVLNDANLRTRLGAAGPGRAADLCDPGIVLPMIENELRKLTASNPTV